jgi:hypothetical protein
MPNHLLRELAPALILLALPAFAADAPPGADQAIGQQFHITADSLPAPGATPSADDTPITIPARHARTDRPRRLHGAARRRWPA